MYNLKDIYKTKNIRASAVYRLYYAGEVIYVGQSRDVRSRLIAHHNWKQRLADLEKKKDGLSIKGYKVQRARYEFIRDHLNEIYYDIEFVAVDDLDQVEKETIEKYLPPYNFQGVYVPYVPAKKRETQNN